jgi:hypothetical protein
MAKEFKEEVLKQIPVNLKNTHVEYLAIHGNKSKFLRWILNNDKGYKKFMKGKNAATRTSSQHSGARQKT